MRNYSEIMSRVYDIQTEIKETIEWIEDAEIRHIESKDLWSQEHISEIDMAWKKITALRNQLKGIKFCLELQEDEAILS